MKTQQNIGCQICLPTNQTASHVGILILKLQQILLNKKSQKELKQNSIVNNTSFGQLVDYIFKQYNQEQRQKACSHQQLKNYYLKKLVIEWQELTALSQSIYQEVIKKKYELQVINQISKNLFKTVQQKSQKNKFDNCNENDQQQLIQDNKTFKKHKKNLNQKINENLIKNELWKENQDQKVDQIQIKTQNKEKINFKVEQIEKMSQNQDFFSKSYEFQQPNSQYYNQKYNNQFNIFNSMSAHQHNQHQIQQNQNNFPFYYVPNRNLTYYGNQNFNGSYQYNYPMMQMPNYQNYNHAISSSSSSSSEQQ